MGDDSALRNTQMHNTINNTWLIQQQFSFERTSSNFLNNLNTQTASNYSSTRDLLVMDFGRIPFGFGSNGAIYGAQVFPDRAGKTLSRQDVAGGLQTGGDVLVGAGVGCGFAVVCSPASPYLILGGGAINAIGITLDTELSWAQKGFSILGGSVVGGKVTKIALEGGISLPMSKAFGESTGYFFGGLPNSYNQQCKDIKPPYRC